MKKRKGTARLITIDGYQVLKENNYSLEQVWLPHGSACFRGTRMMLSQRHLPVSHAFLCSTVS